LSAISLLPYHIKFITIIHADKRMVTSSRPDAYYQKSHIVGLFFF